MKAVIDSNFFKSEEVPGAGKVILDEIRGAAEVTAVAGAQELQIFSLNQGTLPKFLSNQVGSGGFLPAPEAFAVTGIKFTLATSNGKPVLFQDAIDIYSQGTFTFEVSNRPELQGWLQSHVPTNIVVPIDAKPEQTLCVNLASFVSLANNPVKISQSRPFSLTVNINKQVGTAGYAAAYGHLYCVVQLLGYRLTAVK